jgi:hypothetical protein
MQRMRAENPNPWPVLVLIPDYAALGRAYPQMRSKYLGVRHNMRGYLKIDYSLLILVKSDRIRNQERAMGRGRCESYK